MSSRHDERPFLSIIAWPDGYDRASLARLLARPDGLDEVTLRYRLGRTPPMIVGQVAPQVAHDALVTLIRHGGDGFAPTLDDIAAVGATLKIKDMRLVGGALEVDLWRGLSTTLQRAQIQILIRAQVRETIIKRDEPPSGPIRGSGGMIHPSLTVGRVASGLALGFGEAYISNADLETGRGGQRELQTSDKLDIHTTDGSVYQVDGDKFGYGILGDLRGHADAVNMDRLCELLSHISPDEIVDPYFPLWSPPPGYQRLHLPDMKVNNDDPAFAFYSRWSALMYRQLLR